MSILKTVIKYAAPVPKPESFGRFLFVSPHPDDLEIGAGATIAKLAAEGKKICFLICADGRFGTANCPGKSPEELIGIRKQEQLNAAKALGVDDVRFLDLCDAGLYDPEDMLRGIIKTVGDFKPDIIFAPDPCVSSECHPDHLNTGRAAARAAFIAPFENIMNRYGAGAAEVQAIAFYFTARPNRFVNTTGYLEKQLKVMLERFPSQIPEGSEDAKSFSLYLKLRAYDFGLRNFCRTAEGFRVLGKTQMHCLPEAGD